MKLAIEESVLRQALDDNRDFGALRARTILAIQTALDAAEKVEPVRQYYYKVNGCPAESAHDPNCICWHDEGTGPMQPMLDGSYLIGMTWRTTNPAPAVSEKVDLSDIGLVGLEALK